MISILRGSGSTELEESSVEIVRCELRSLKAVREGLLPCSCEVASDFCLDMSELTSVKDEHPSDSALESDSIGGNDRPRRYVRRARRNGLSNRYLERATKA